MSHLPNLDSASVDKSGIATAGGKAIPEQDEVIHLLPIVNIFLINRRYIFLPACYLAFGVWLLTLLLSPVYTATASFMISGNSSNEKVAGGNLNTGVDAGIDEFSGLPQYWSALLHSSEFLTKVVKPQLGLDVKKSHANWLRELVGDDDDPDATTQKAVNLLKGMVSISPDPKSKRVILQLSVTSTDPTLSSNIAESLIQAISAYGGDERNQKAIENRDFIQQRLSITEQELGKAEKALTSFLTRNKKTNLPRMETDKQRLERAVTVQEELFMSLRKQLELAKLKVQEDSTVLRILEQPSAQRTGPKRLRMVLVAFFVGLVIFGGRIFVRDRIAKMDRNDPDVHLFLDQIHGIESDFARWRDALSAVTKRFQGWLLQRLGR